MMEPPLNGEQKKNFLGVKTLPLMMMQLQITNICLVLYLITIKKLWWNE